MDKKLNKLQYETSQYLRAHATNPVDWYPWGREAFGKAKRENKPIFLSIGYSACHWCHVMEKESFENEATALLMNKYFVNIKVDREERQDLDHIYMTAVQLLTGRGGWPMSVFLTPELKPFYGGTYFPPEDRHGLPSFAKVLTGIANAWATKPKDIVASSEELFQSLSNVQLAAASESKTFSPSIFKESVHKILSSFDETNGGIGSAPKFFHTGDIQAALLQYSREKDPKAESCLKKTWEAWSWGGIYDQLGGGFHRYSTDEKWFAPHFEKMLYDNALVTATFVEGYKLFRSPLYSQVAAHTLDYIVREMTSTEGGYYSTEDADSEGEEGKYYVWSKEEISTLLGTDMSAVFCKAYNVKEKGNWEHSNILHLSQSMEDLARELKVELSELEDTLSLSKRKLLLERSRRVRPNRDEKIITSWNAMMVETMAKASFALGNEKYLESAIHASEFILKRLKNADGLLHSYQEGKAVLSAYLDDWGTLCNAFITLYEISMDEKWLNEALSLSEDMITRFYDGKSDFYFTEKKQEHLIYRPKESYDGATPSATAIALTALARLGRITDRKSLLDIVDKTLLTYETQIKQTPSAFAQMLLASEYLKPSCKEIVFIPGDNDEENIEVRHVLHSNYHGTHVVVYPGALLNKTGLLKGKQSINKKATIYICENQTCKEPQVGIEAITKQLAHSLNS